jgi:hypothetical protein
MPVMRIGAVATPSVSEILLSDATGEGRLREASTEVAESDAQKTDGAI